MLLRIPDFYDKFTCIADRCTDTCCVGWEIDVDSATLSKYSKLVDNQQVSLDKREFARHIMANIDESHIKLAPGDRCPFLKENGLCDMICHLGCNGTDKDENGENVLCDICREHPRFVEVYGDIMEKGVGLCCEEAVRLLLTNGISFVEREINDEPDEMPEGAEEARDAIFEEREAIFAILNDSGIPLNQRLIEVLDFAEATSGNEIPINEDFSDDSENRFEDSPSCHSERSEESCHSEQAIYQTWIEILSKGESYGPAWDKAYKHMIRKGWQQPQSLFSDEDGARIIAYMIFRYYAKSLFDGDSLTKVQFAIYFWIILKHFGEELAADSPAGTTDLTRKINAIKLLSKQTEYSEEIMGILADNFFENPAFSVEQFRKHL